MNELSQSCSMNQYSDAEIYVIHTVQISWAYLALIYNAIEKILGGGLLILMLENSMFKYYFGCHTKTTRDIMGKCNLWSVLIASGKVFSYSSPSCRHKLVNKLLLSCDKCYRLSKVSSVKLVAYDNA